MFYTKLKNQTQEKVETVRETEFSTAMESQQPQLRRTPQAAADPNPFQIPNPFSIAALVALIEHKHFRHWRLETTFTGTTSSSSCIYMQLIKLMMSEWVSNWNLIETHINMYLLFFTFFLFFFVFVLLIVVRHWVLFVVLNSPELIYEGMDFIYLLNGWFDVDMNFICWLNVDFFLVILRILMNLVWMWRSSRRKKMKKRKIKISCWRSTIKYNRSAIEWLKSYQKY